MKFSNLTYYLLTILCLMATSCTSEGLMDDGSINGKGQGELIQGGNVNFAITFPTIDAPENNVTPAEVEIHELQIYTFVHDKFVEKIKYPVITGEDGDATRSVIGRLMEAYPADTPIEVVFIANTAPVKLADVMPYQGASKADLYKLLLFYFDATRIQWCANVLMWGEGRIDSIQADTVNFGSLTLERSMAKVNITVNNGDGLAGFLITSVEIHNCNTHGYCAPLDKNGPSIPGSSSISDEVYSSGPLSSLEANRIENKFYIPEHKNIGVDNKNKIYLVINATVSGKEERYIIPFSNNGRDFDVLRNNLYVFNITGFKMGVDLKYDVKEWVIKNVDVPSFD